MITTGATGAECAAFAPVYVEIIKATRGQRPAALAGIVEADAQAWFNELTYASQPPPLAKAGLDIDQATIYMDDEVRGAHFSKVAWDKVTQQFAVVLKDCERPSGT
jgi:hypothetical protein